MRTNVSAELVGIAVAPSRPVESERGEDRSHRMISVACDSALRSERQQNLWTKFADIKHQFARHLVSLSAMQLPVGVVEHDSSRHLQNRASGRKFLTSHRGQFQVISRASPMAPGLSRSKANHARFDS